MSKATYNRWTEERIAELLHLLANKSRDQVAAHFALTLAGLQSAIWRLQITEEEIAAARWKTGPWTKAEDRQLKRLYSKYLNPEIAEIMNRPDYSIMNRARALGLRKPDEVRRRACFQKGIKPWNTGTKGLVKPNSGQFKKGQTPPNKCEIGDVVPRLDSNGNRYLWIKVSDRKCRYTIENWQPYHVYLWEQEHGPVPKGGCVEFIDGDQMNCIIGNLRLVTRAEHIRNNIATRLSMKGRGQIDKELRDEILTNHPALIEAKRAGMQLNRLVNPKSKQNG